MHIEDSIIIKGELESIYGLARDVENYPSFIPGYLESKIVDYWEGKPVIQRVTMVKGRQIAWRSIASFMSDKSIEFEQIEGKLKGMKARWKFEVVPEGTKVIISHDFTLRPIFIGKLLEIFVAKPAVSKIAKTVLEAIKNKIENIK